MTESAHALPSSRGGRRRQTKRVEAVGDDGENERQDEGPGPTLWLQTDSIMPSHLGLLSQRDAQGHSPRK